MTTYASKKPSPSLPSNHNPLLNSWTLAGGVLLTVDQKSVAAWLLTEDGLVGGCRWQEGLPRRQYLGLIAALSWVHPRCLPPRAKSGWLALIEMFASPTTQQPESSYDPIKYLAVSADFLDTSGRICATTTITIYPFVSSLLVAVGECRRSHSARGGWGG